MNKDLLEKIVKALVDHPDDVNITEASSENVIILEISVHSEDTGKVIGREGRIANAIRTIAKASGAKENKKINIEIITD